MTVYTGTEEPMTEEFKVTMQMKKQELIDEHEKLLEAYKKKLSELEAAQQREAAAVAKAESLDGAREATVDGVIENVGQLRSQMGKTLNDLTERMTGQAERMEGLNRAIAEREQRLEELGDIEGASTSLATLIAAYDERREATEREFASRIAEMEEQGRALQAKLQSEIAEQRTQWQAERAKVEAELAEEAERRERERAREQEEYEYQRDRARRLEKDQYADQIAQQRRELEDALAKEKATFESWKAQQSAEIEAHQRVLEEREAALAAREHEYQELLRRMDELPAQIEAAKTAAAEEARQAARAEVAHEQKVAALEHEWNVKVLKERIASLERDVKERDAKLKEVKADLDSAWQQVHQMAEKALDRDTYRPAPAPTRTPEPQES
jgi:chromosome segregation ATPase